MRAKLIVLEECAGDGRGFEVSDGIRSRSCAL